MTKHAWQRILKDARGATAVEYGLLAAGLGVLVAGAVLTLGVDVAALFGRTGSTIGEAAGVSAAEMRVIAQNNFETGREEWTGGTLVTIPLIGTGLSLAGPQTGGRELMRRTFEIPDAATRAEVTFDMSFVDSWDNEDANIYLDGRIIGTGNFSWNSGQLPTLNFVPVAGVTASAELVSSVRTGTWTRANSLDHTYTVKLAVDNPDSTLTLGFGTTLNSGANDESLLISNVAVSANG